VYLLSLRLKANKAAKKTGGVNKNQVQEMVDLELPIKGLKGWVIASDKGRCSQGCENRHVEVGTKTKNVVENERDKDSQ